MFWFKLKILICKYINKTVNVCVVIINSYKQLTPVWTGHPSVTWPQTPQTHAWHDMSDMTWVTWHTCKLAQHHVCMYVMPCSGNKWRNLSYVTAMLMHIIIVLTWNHGCSGQLRCSSKFRVHQQSLPLQNSVLWGCHVWSFQMVLAVPDSFLTLLLTGF